MDAPRPPSRAASVGEANPAGEANKAGASQWPAMVARVWGPFRVGGTCTHTALRRIPGPGGGSATQPSRLPISIT